MIRETRTTGDSEAITSDQWHVVLSHFTEGGRPRPFARDVHSEHPDRATCLAAARALLKQVRAGAADTPLAERDEVFVRKPGFKSLKWAKSRSAKA